MTSGLTQVTGITAVTGSGSGPSGANAVATAAALYGIPHKPQIVTSRNAVSEGNGNGTLYTGIMLNGTRLDARPFQTVGPQAVTQLQILVPGWFFNQSGVGDMALGDDLNYEAGIENITPSATQQVYFAGQKIVSVPSGIPFIESDAVQGIDLAAGTQIWVRHSYVLPYQSGNIPFQFNYATTSDFGQLTASSVSQVAGTGTMSNSSPGSGVTGPAPILIGIPAAPHPSVIYFGDSIADGSGDTVNNTTGGTSYIGRGLDGVNGFTVPYLKLTCPGWNYQNSTLSNPAHYRSFWKFGTHFICEMGVNDLKGSPTLAGMQAYATAIATAAKRTLGPYGKPLQVAFCTITPCTSSTDSWATAANQTYFSAVFAPGGIRDQYNAWLISQKGLGLIDYVIDVTPYTDDPANHGKWVSNGTANYATGDGLHPSAAMHLLISAAVNAYALTMTP